MSTSILSDIPWLLSGYLISYLALHSLLASQIVKRRVTQFTRCSNASYRLAYNLLAITLLVPFWMLYQSQNWPLLWYWSGELRYVQVAIWIVSGSVFLLTLRHYDNQAFIGLREETTTLTLSPPHRFVRHPWYTCALAIIWSQNMDTALFTSSIIISLYFVIGSRLEEKRLLLHYANRYREYMNAVPALIPLPGRYINKNQLEFFERGFNNPNRAQEDGTLE